MATEPISEQELAEIEAAVRDTGAIDEDWAYSGHSGVLLLRLVDEVRRLRAEAAPRPHAPDYPLAPPRHQHGLPPAAPEEA